MHSSPPHPLFDHLSAVCELLSKHKIPYYLAGGTLLGAVRENGLIQHDTDFDIDCMAEDEERIFALEDQFRELGLTIHHKVRPTPLVALNGLVPTDAGIRSCRCIKISEKGKPVGDIYPFQRFSDGISRRYDFATATYYNAKMSLPTWFYDNPQKVSVYGKTFTTVCAPEKVCEKIYGSDWQTPLARGQYKKGRNKGSGSVFDADIESLIEYAISRGWNSDYSKFPEWPQEVKFTNSKASLRWITKHEPALNGEFTAILNLARAEGYKYLLLIQIAIAKARNTCSSDKPKKETLSKTFASRIKRLLRRR